jgi:phage N-6-adenine-methyltransferase
MKCPVCKYKFQPTRADAKTCSPACRQMRHRRRLGVTARNIERRFKRNVQACSCTGVHFSSKTDLWSTPQDFFDKLDTEFNFTVDLCATPENAKCERFYAKSENGLAQTWIGTCWLNPPYGTEIGLWLSKAREAALAGATVVALIPARTDTKWWHGIVTAASEIRYLPGRLRFGGCKHSAPFPSAVAIWRPSR